MEGRPPSWTQVGSLEARRCGRFAPSTTGRAHLGTYLSALLAWCDARRYGGQLLLRLEDLDPARSRPELAAGLQEDLAWLGLDFDGVCHQSAYHERHRAALAQLAAAGRLYACTCSRSKLRGQGAMVRLAHSPGNPGVGAADPCDFVRPEGHLCAAAPVDGRSWATTAAPLRLRCAAVATTCDPVVRRRDGAIAYLLASVVDDAAEGVTHIVRGRDLAALVPLQTEIYRALGWPRPMWRHHLLLCRPAGQKLAKVHGDAGLAVLGPHPNPRALCGWLAWAAGLRPCASPTTPAALAADFSWRRLRRADREVPSPL